MTIESVNGRTELIIPLSEKKPSVILYRQLSNLRPKSAGPKPSTETRNDLHTETCLVY